MPQSGKRASPVCGALRPAISVVFVRKIAGFGAESDEFPLSVEHRRGDPPPAMRSTVSSARRCSYTAKLHICQF